MATCAKRLIGEKRAVEGGTDAEVCTVVCAEEEDRTREGSITA
jgi:hypothetical protein